MTSKTINANVLTSTSKLDSLAAADGSLRPILLGRMDVSMISNGANLLGSAANNARWEFNVKDGASLTKNNDGTYDYVRGTYPAVAAPWNKVIFKFDRRDETDICVQFWARKSAGGMPKFVKFYGQNNGGYANTTFKGADYVNGTIDAIGYGDGTGTTNDSQMGVYYDTGRNTDFYTGRPGSLTRSFVNGGKFDVGEWGDGSAWQKFQLRVKFNSGTTALNEVNDGIVESRINNVVRCRGENIFNRHYSNPPLDSVEFLSYVQGAPAFTMDIRSITVSRNGWID